MLFGFEVNPVLIVALVMGLVEFSKKLGVQGKASIGMSMFFGVVLGAVYYLGQWIYPGLNDWLGVVIGSLIFGLAACGLWDMGKSFTDK